MSHPIIQELNKEYFRSDLPDMSCGDTVVVQVRIIEGGKERIQAYEGVVIKVQGAGLGKTITVRRVFQGVGVERIFLLHSPRVAKFVVKRKGAVRRAKLYYLRNLKGKAARIKEKQSFRKESK